MEENFIPCRITYLPEDQLVGAAQAAISINPFNQPYIGSIAKKFLERIGVLKEDVEDPLHLSALTTKYWGVGGVALTVGFMEEIGDDLAARIIAHANAWGKYGNVKFSRTKTDPQVRITRSKEGYYSYVGVDNLRIPKNEETMCLSEFTMNTPEGEFVRVVRHEFGHVLGFPHEHMRASLVARIDPQKAVAYFMRTQGWTAAMVHAQVLKPISEASLMGTPGADQASIMCYFLPPEITVDGLPIIGGTDIDELDKGFVAKIYPLPNQPPPPPPPVSPPPPPPVAGKGVISIRLDLEGKKAGLSMPAGWKASKQNEVRNSTSEEEEPMTNLESQTDIILAQCAADLEALGAEAPASAGRALGIGVVVMAWPIVQKLILAIKAKDYVAIAKAVRDLLTLFLGDSASTGEINFATAQSALGDGHAMRKIGEVIVKLLPIILGLI